MFCSRVGLLPKFEKTLSIGPGWLSSNSPFRLIQAINAFGIQSWFYSQIRRISEGLDPDLSLNPLKAFREDGKTLRIDTSTPELDYVKIKEDYSNLLQDYNLNPEYFEDQIETLFKNDVSPFTFEQRLDTAYNALFNQFDAVKQYYVNNYPDVFPSTEDITDEAIFASFISEDISEEINKRRLPYRKSE